MNPWEELLASIKEDPDRQAAEQLASKYPELKNGWLRQSDYSRKMDELKLKDEYVRGWEKWKAENWVDDAYPLPDGTKVGAMKRELEKDAVILELQRKIEAGGEMTQEDVMKALDGEFAKRGFVSKESFDGVLKEKETGLKGYVETWGSINLSAVRRGFEHLREFNEVLDPREVIKFGTEKGKATFDEAYDAMVSDKRAEAVKAKHEAELAAARAEGAAAKEKELQGKGVMPVDMGEQELGPLMTFMNGKKPADGDTSELPFGRGQIGRAAAMQG